MQITDTLLLLEKLPVRNVILCFILLNDNILFYVFFKFWETFLMLLLMTHSTNILKLSVSQLVSEKGKVKVTVTRKAKTSLFRDSFLALKHFVSKRIIISRLWATLRLGNFFYKELSKTWQMNGQVTGLQWELLVFHKAVKDGGLSVDAVQWWVNLYGLLQLAEKD